MRKLRAGGSAVLASGTVLAGLLLGWSPGALALDPAVDIDQYAHTSWKIREGFTKGAITSLAQTADGYLWLGTEFGLVRFDGVRAVPWEPPPGQALPSSFIRSLLAARDGTLWIATLTGLVSWKDGRLTRYPELGDQSPWRLLEDRNGVIWVGTYGMPAGRLCAVRNGSAECYGDDGRFGSGVARVYEDLKGQLWVGVKGGVWRWKPAPPTFYPLAGDPIGVQGVSEDEDGALLIGMGGRILRLVDGRTTPYPLPEGLGTFQTRAIFRDRDGGRWIGTLERGLVHVHQGRTDVFARADGLSADFVVSIFEDREGDIWVATQGGLDRFHDLAVPTYSLRQGLSNAEVGSVLAADDGSVWLATRNGLNVWRNGQVTVPRIDAGRRDGRPEALAPHTLHQDARGRIWVSTFGGVGFLENDRFAFVPGIPGGNVWGMVDDAAGTLWIANQNLGLFRLSAQRDVEQVSWKSLGHTGGATALAAEPQGKGVWMGFVDGGLAYFAQGEVRRRYGVADGLAEGRVGDLRVDPDGTLWAATHGGLSRLRNGRVATLGTRNGLPCDAVHWSIEDEDRAVWLYMACGLVRVARSQIDAAADAAETVEGSRRPLQTTVFDVSDGVSVHAFSGNYKPQVARSTDGRLWFSSGGDGVSVIDPRNIHVNPLPPPVHVEQVTADRKTYDAPPAGGRLRLPPRVRDVQIDYTALSLVATEKVGFRYKLEGWDRDWQDAGNRRQAFYANLPPRDYRFHVMACNNSGVWNEAGASLDFRLDPAYYQTEWFRFAVAVLILGAAAAFYRLRVRQVAQRVRLRMEGRLEERERIARDLHDTLLQSVQGLILKFDAAVKKIPAGDPARRAIEETLDRADEILAEGRDKVRSLRTGDALGDLPSALERVAGESAHDAATRFKSVVEGHPRDLDPLVLEEAFAIGREALVNALTHSAAAHVELEIAYDPRQLRVRIRDDGKGIEEKIVESGRAGHWGMQGMRERATRIGAHFNIWSRPGAGTEVELTVPAATAYRGRGSAVKTTDAGRAAGLS